MEFAFRSCDYAFMTDVSLYPGPRTRGGLLRVQQLLAETQASID